MPRNLDISALRSLVTVAETGSVTRAAGLLNLTQSAVSMQIRRLEESLGERLFAREPKRMVLTAPGETLVQFGRRICEINDEALGRVGAYSAMSEIRLGVPYDIVNPQIPRVLKEMAASWPMLRINLVTSYTRILKERFRAGEFDLILTTEQHPDAGAQVLSEERLVWVGAEGGRAHHARPLRAAFKETCIFRPVALAALAAAGIGWEMAFDGESETVIEATVAADLGVSVRMASNLPQGCVPVEGLPALPGSKICLYDQVSPLSEAVEALKNALACGYSG